MRGKPRPAFRRTRRTAVLVGSIAGLTLVATSPGAAAPAQESFNKGTGSALAESVRVDPIAGGLSFGVGVGQSLAGHQNTIGQAESRAFDLGVVGVTLGGEACDGGDPTLASEDQPQPERVSTGEEGAEQGHRSTESFAGGQMTKEVRATDDPLAEAITVGAPFEVPGLLRVGATRALARSGVVDDATREAIAVSEISSVSFAGGAAELRGLRWEAIHRTGKVHEEVGRFTIDAFEVAGVPVRAEDLTQLNAALNPLGFELKPPKVRKVDTSGGTIVIVDPLSIAVVPNETRDSALGGVLGGAQPIREPLADALIDFDCGNASYITIADVALSSISGGGTLSISLGGARATTAEIKLFQGLGELPPLPPLSPAAPLPGSPGVAGSPAVPAVPGTSGAPASTATTESGGDEVAADPIERISDLTGERGGAMALVSAGGLLALLGVAEADRRKMRSALRAIPTEV